MSHRLAPLTLVALLAGPAAAHADATLARLTDEARTCAARYDGALTVHTCRRAFDALIGYVDARRGRGAGDTYLVRTVTDPGGRPLPAPRCRYRPLEAPAAQRQANAAIARIRLREDLIGTRFAVTSISFDVTVDDPGAVNRSLNDLAEARRCFPYYVHRLSILRAEYTRRSAGAGR